VPWGREYYHLANAAAFRGITELLVKRAALYPPDYAMLHTVVPVEIEGVQSFV
jgi:hypothetical protein